MNPNFLNKQDERGENQGSEHFLPSAGDDQDFAFAEEKKPINRNMIVLVLIVVLGGGLVYFMYLRSSVEVEQTPASIEAGKQIDGFIQNGKANMDQLQKMLLNTQKVVEVFKQDSAEGQVPTEKLKTNPFQFEQSRTNAGTPVQQITADPAEQARLAAAKAQLQTILYSPNGSTCIINGRICSEGQKVTIDSVPFVVKEIGSDHVVLTNKLLRPAGEYTVELRKSDLTK